MGVGFAITLYKSNSETNANNGAGSVTAPITTNSDADDTADSATQETDAICASDAHEWDDEVINAMPTCESEGTKTITCKKCGQTETEQIASLGHKWAAAPFVVSPSADGCVVTTKCENDPTHTKSETIAHTWNSGAVTRSATTTQKGIKTFTCTTCGGTYEQEIPKVKAATTTTTTILQPDYYTYEAMYVIVNTNYTGLELRTGPSIKYTSQKNMKEGDFVTVLGGSNTISNWYYVRYYNPSTGVNMYGWCNNKYLSYVG